MLEEQYDRCSASMEEAVRGRVIKIVSRIAEAIAVAVLRYLREDRPARKGRHLAIG